MKKNILLLAVLFFGVGITAQITNNKVGINTETPTETLDVNGIVHADLLYLRSPGNPQELPIKFMASSNRSLDVYNSTTGNSSLVNYLKLNFTNVSNLGITDYDTKISAADFTVAVRSYSVENSAGNPNLLDVYTVHNNNASKTTGTYSQGSPDFTAFVQGGTWHVRARYINAKISKNDADVGTANRYVIRLQLLVYKELITRNYPTVLPTVDYGGTTPSSAIAPRPSTSF